MLLVADVRKELRKRIKSGTRGIDRINEICSSLSAIVYLDYSVKIQTLHKETNPECGKLLNAFKKLIGCSVEPILCTLSEVYKCFMRTGMAYLVMGDFLLDKKKQPELYIKEKFVLD